MNVATPPRIVIVGGGFGGLYAARALKRADAQITVIDRTNHHLFQPLLYQVALAALAPSDITAPIRWLLRKQRNTRVLLGNVSAVDPQRRVVHVDGDMGDVPYDYLILSPGARHSYFGRDEWTPHAPGLKSLDDAMEIRRRFLVAFEEAELTTDDAVRRELLTFVVIGGGPTGVELAGMIPDVARAMCSDFRAFNPTTLRVILLEGGPRILPTFPEKLSEHARADLRALGVEVRTGAMVTSVDARGVRIGDEFIGARTTFWAAGNKASSLGKSLGVPLDRAGRVLVQPDLTIPGHPDVMVIGDLASLARPNGALVPGVAPAAMQMGAHAARNIVRSLRGEGTRPFAYVNKGELATIGRHKAIADFGFFTVAGYAAWFFWLLLHIMFLAGFRNRLSVLLQWAYMYWTYRRGVRLISGSEHHVLATTRDWPMPTGRA